MLAKTHKKVFKHTICIKDFSDITILNTPVRDKMKEKFIWFAFVKSRKQEKGDSGPEEPGKQSSFVWITELLNLVSHVIWIIGTFWQVINTNSLQFKLDNLLWCFPFWYTELQVKIVIVTTFFASFIILFPCFLFKSDFISE